LELVLNKPVDSKQAGGYIRVRVDMSEQQISQFGMAASE
jgi:hypothetical protein